jgi:hypothetical protein
MRITSLQILELRLQISGYTLQVLIWILKPLACNL